MPALTDLPTELLQLIAGGCPAPDILALSRTCRRLNKACDSAAVFRLSFKTHLPELTSSAFESKTKLVRFMDNYVDGSNKPCQRNEGPKLTWLCLAVAVSRLPDTLPELERLTEPLTSSVKIRGGLRLLMRKPQQLDNDSKGSLQGLMAFLCTLPIWGYTIACNSGVAAILDDLCPVLFSQLPELKSLRIDQFIGDENPLQFAFCLALSNLETWRESEDLRDPKRPVHHILVKENYDSNTRDPEYEKFQGSWIGKQTHALLLADLIARNIHYVSKGGKPSIYVSFLNFESGILNTDIPTGLPNPKKIEFLSSWYFTGDRGKNVEHGAWAGAATIRPRFPLLTPNLITPLGKKGRFFYPFTGDGWWSWYTTRVRDLARRLDEGEWYGTYMHTLLLGSRFGQPMEGIRFRKTSEDGDIYLIEAPDGVDGGGAFTLRGRVNSSAAACTVDLQKKYDSVTIDCLGLVTPLGICGGCYVPGPRSSRAVGYFWLWKREWMNNMVN
ncbi:hypothetical protein GGS26DRAFT_594757 [Hypomontagnella submonticulosa]|nr:hypothetical protein GGS26DRAFT_594757 [Hypomontagnella submonticulosa]